MIIYCWVFSSLQQCSTFGCHTKIQPLLYLILKSFAKLLMHCLCPLCVVFQFDPFNNHNPNLLLGV